MGRSTTAGCAPEYVGARVSRDRMCMPWAPAAASFGGGSRVQGTPTYLVGLCPLLSLTGVSSRLGASYPSGYLRYSTQSIFRTMWGRTHQCGTMQKPRQHGERPFFVRGLCVVCAYTSSWERIVDRSKNGCPSEGRRLRVRLCRVRARAVSLTTFPPPRFGTNSHSIFHFRFLRHKFRGTTVVPRFLKTGKSRTTLCPEVVLKKRCLCYTYVGPFVNSLCPETVHEKRKKK